MAIMQGDLAEYPVPDLLQFIHASRKQGQLILESPTVVRPAGVFFAGGELVHAYCPPAVGVPALYQLLGWQHGRFAFLKGAPPPERTIHAELQNLILEGLRRLDEFRVLEAHLPPFDTALHLALDQAASDEIRLTHAEWRLLSQVNGRRTLGELIDVSGRPADEAARLFYGLLSAGLVTAEHDDAYLDLIVPAKVPTAEAPPNRAAPPTILANLLLQKVDGRRSLRALLAALGCDRHALAEELRLLVRTGWVRIDAGAEDWRRHLAG
jgi:hypothetical protein